tara:strand:+ start:2792 stop:4096 length:1305 start_codon:yes stop_codon:yes gene_type:complete
MLTSSKKFRKILNDLKRRPEDAAKDLGVSKKRIQKILRNKTFSDTNILEKAVKVWPVNYSDFFFTQDDTRNGYKIFRLSESNKSERIMHRGGKPYYSYKDTVMSKLSPFRPEWIKELLVVKNNKPTNTNVKFNNGHFLHQFTYFIGPVNFYYIENGKKKVAIMNTGDSMYISPYIPHSFTTRSNKENILGSILALTYTDKIDGETVNELSAIGHDLVKIYKINSLNKNKNFYENLKYHLNAASLPFEILNQKLNVKINKGKIPNIKKINQIANYLNINLRDLLPPIKSKPVKIKKYKENRYWYHPSQKNKNYKFVELTNLPELPISKAYELEVLIEKNNDQFLVVPCHQYIFNIGNSKCEINLKNKYRYKANLNPGDSIYIKPNLKHNFTKKSKILVLRIGGKISGDVFYQMSMMSEKNLKRLVNDNLPWFNSK